MTDEKQEDNISPKIYKEEPGDAINNPAPVEISSKDGEVDKEVQKKSAQKKEEDKKKEQSQNDTSGEDG